MASNSELEMRWVDAWNDLYDILGLRHDAPCQLPDGSVVDVQQCLAWLQDSAYEGYFIRVESGWVGHLRGVLARRWREGDSSLEKVVKIKEDDAGIQAEDRVQDAIHARAGRNALGRMVDEP